MREDIQKFNVVIAKKYGVLGAVILEYIDKRVNCGDLAFENNDNNIKEYDGQNWFCYSIKDYIKKCPYTSGATIRKVLNRLIDDGMILENILSEDPFDRRKWYTITFRGMSFISDCYKGKYND